MREKSVFYGLTPVQLMLVLAGGLAMFLSTKEAHQYISSSLGGAYVGFVAAVTCVVLIAIFRSYEVIGASLLVSSVLFAIEYIVYCANSLFNAYEAGTQAILDISPHTATYWFIVWAIPSVACMIIRLISLKNLESEELLEDFSLFFRSSTISFYIFYTLIILGAIVFTVPIGSGGIIKFNLIPFNNPMSYFSFGIGLSKTIANLILLVPIGYTLTVFYNKFSLWQKVLIGVTISVLIQLLIIIFNTGDFDITYVILNIVGLFIGIGIKLLMDKLQYIISNKKHTAMRYF